MTTLYLTEPGTVVRFRNESLLIERQQQVQSRRLAELTLVTVLPGVQLTSTAMAELLDRGIETLFLRQDGGFRGRLQGEFSTNPAIRLAQFRTVGTSFGLELARRLVVGKVHNQRALLQRRNRAAQQPIGELTQAIEQMASYLPRLQIAASPLSRDELMGVEGICARVYYQALRYWFPAQWQFAGRSRQPPLDPVNALLSWGYGVLRSRVFSACVQAGLDPYLGFFHAIEPYRPNLVLDLMEEFRPLVVDLTVIAMIGKNLLDPGDFQVSPDGVGVWLGPMAKKLFLAQLEQQLRKPLLYPPQNRRLSLTQILLEQARWVGRCLVEQELNYEAFVLR